MYDLDRLLSNDTCREHLARSFAAAVPADRLRDAKLKITSRCNLRCGMCHYGQRDGERELDTHQWRTVLSQLHELGCAKVHLSGGEPLIRRDLLSIVEHSISLGLKTNLTTNGTLMSREQAKQLVQLGVRGLSVSLDGPTARLHDAIRGSAGAFKQAVRAIGWLRKASLARKRPPQLRINVVVMRDNFRRLAEMVRLAGELGADDLIPMPVDEHGESRRRLSGGQIERYNAEIAPEVLELRRRYGFALRAERIFPFGTTRRDVRYAKRGLYARGYYERLPCFAPWFHLFVAWNGTIYPCCMTTERAEPLGDVRSEALEAIVHGERYHRLRQLFVARKALPMCHRCDLFAQENRMVAASLGLHGERSTGGDSLTLA